jgi:hypothetical protein
MDEHEDLKSLHLLTNLFHKPAPLNQRGIHTPHNT